ncbi:cytochrome c biogenesis protein CcsA [Hymenobacter sp. BRD128]|uniref:cytochrome c biogenesis protein CcsA n=1 Tax=Hymenobacter sp. BRD128 TaxID=2675878 RepID=UPI001566F228|nr:cytochrome c biogenesis protein CcsA [Hymenobacter sp. BRD128]QKG57569.1 cytochrome c biogenesis protein CcsA [Hymenobacter sp. BRD128]
MNLLIGNLGQASVILAFVAAAVAAYGYFQAARGRALGQADASWLRLARGAFFVHGAAVLAVVCCLFNIIHAHRYEYYYAWSHSSNHLPVQYMISCFWEGQEGSFLLWIFWHVVLGLGIMKFNRQWEAPVLAVFATVQAFLVSMILGVVVAGVKIGSSPFILLRDFMVDLPVWKLNPNFVPKDGSGLNALLQNYWMVIHPPTLFLGFALTLVPFAFAIAGLWKKEITTWVKPALPWTALGGAVLGVGIMMGAYWAYETLNFGGFWNWDPVENAVYIPWLVLIAALHGMVLWQRRRTGLRTAYALVVATFVLILYATFLTRSGVLGNASVHSFTDLGLSGQLIIYLAFFTVGAIALLASRWKSIPVSEKELTAYSPELWIFVGATVLCLAAFQVVATTSIPVYNSFLGFIGIKSNLALPADQIQHYTRIQLWAGVLIGLCSGIAQILWWRPAKESVLNSLATPTMLALLTTALVVLLTRYFGHTMSAPYVTLLLAGLFGIMTNASAIFGLWRRRVQLSGGAVSHLGIALMLLGILASAGYSNTISRNNSGKLISREMSAADNENNVLLWRNETGAMNGYDVTYTGQYLDVPGLPDYVNTQLLYRTDDEYKAVARGEIKQGDKTYFHTGDSLTIRPENTYYRVEYNDKKTGQKFTLFPRAQVNEEMGGLLASPALQRFWDHDIYSHISSVPDPRKEIPWSAAVPHELSVGDTLFLNDYFAVFRAIEQAHDVPGIKLEKGDIALQADMIITGEKGRQYHAHPVFLLRDRQVGRVPEIIEDLGLKISLDQIDPVKGKFTFAIATTGKDYIILKATEKPFINLLWGGTLLMGLGLVLSMRQRKASRAAAVASPAEAIGRAGAARPQAVA